MPSTDSLAFPSKRWDQFCRDLLRALVVAGYFLRSEKRRTVLISTAGDYYTASCVSAFLLWDAISNDYLITNQTHRPRMDSDVNGTDVPNNVEASEPVGHLTTGDRHLLNGRS